MEVSVLMADYILISLFAFDEMTFAYSGAAFVLSASRLKAAVVVQHLTMLKLMTVV